VRSPPLRRALGSGPSKLREYPAAGLRDAKADDLDRAPTRLALPIPRAANGSLLSGQGGAIAPQAECLQLAAISAHPAAVVGTGIKMMAGVDMVHVPYRGGGPALKGDQPHLGRWLWTPCPQS
jgi:hypothetical protein